MSRPFPSRLRLAGLALLSLPLVLAACSSGSGSGGSGPSNSSLQSAGAKVLDQISAYESKAAACKSASNPVVCLEHADLNLGNQIHTYANTLTHARENGTLYSAQTLANSLEILGDAQPTQANYDQVLNTFNLNGAIAQLRTNVQKLDRTLGG